MQTDQTTTAFLVTYLPLDLLTKALDVHSDDIDSYAYIVHDRDVADDGSIKISHIHLFIHTFSAHKLGVFRKWFSNSEFNCLAKSVYSPSGCLAYLTHRNRPDKVQYDDSEVICFNIDSFLSMPISDSRINISAQIVNDIIAHKSTRELVNLYGMNYIKNRRQLTDVAFSIIAEDNASDLSKITHGLKLVHESLPFPDD